MHEQQIFATCFTQPSRSSTKRGQALGRLRGASRGHLEKQTIWKMTALCARNVTFNEKIMHSLWVKTAHKTHLLCRQRTQNAMPRHAEIRPTSLWLWKKNFPSGWSEVVAGVHLFLMPAFISTGCLLAGVARGIMKDRQAAVTNLQGTALDEPDPVMWQSYDAV